MITDDNKGILGIDYNILNLPKRIEINGGTSATTGELEYTYDAADTKLTKTVTGSTVPATNYVGNHIYKGNNLAYILTDEGRIVFNGNNYNFEYNLTDHLGNVRIVLKDDGTVLQKNSYYPYGMQISALSSSSVSGDTENKYLYNGKEMQDEFGLTAYDFDARFYDKQTGRWYNPDPLEQYDSPYVFGGNNPILNIDPSGMWAFPSSSTGSMIGSGQTSDHGRGGTQTSDHYEDRNGSTPQTPEKTEQQKRNEEVARMYNEGDRFQKTAIMSILVWGELMEKLSEFFGGPTGKEVPVLDKFEYIVKTGTGDKVTKSVIGGVIITSGIKHGVLKHWRIMQKYGKNLAKAGNTVYLNKAINTALGKKIPNIGKLKPDIVAVNSENVVTIAEVVSPSQTYTEISDKVTKIKKALQKEGYTVVTKIISPKY